MKNKLFYFSSLLLLSLSLTSCNFFIDTGGSESSSSVHESSFTPVPLGEYAGQDITLKEVKDVSSSYTLKPVGNQNILVIPVTFKDYPLSRIFPEYEVEDFIPNIQKCFFGKANETGWESVSSFYEKSSYGKLHLSGEVAPLVTLDKTLGEFVSLTSSDKQFDPTYYALDYAVNTFKRNYQGDITKFDNNRDGYLDGVWLVYAPSYVNSEPLPFYYRDDSNFRRPGFVSKASNVLWAYTYWKFDEKPSLVSPTPNTYCWASYNFMINEDYKGPGFFSPYKPDAHTFIHETGHMMGLDDYYSYDNGGGGGDTAPCGGLDMMDNNVGDHCSFSKYMFDWVNPKIVKNSGTYHLNSFTNTGDCLLVPTSLDHFNNSPYDEYLLFEYYVPEGLNYIDSYKAYKSGVRNFFKPGVKVYHVNSKLGNLRFDRHRGLIFDGYTSKVVKNNEMYTVIATNNTPSYSYSGERLLTLLSASHNAVNNYYYNDRHRNLANNGDLFTEANTINGFTFDDGRKMNYQVTFKNLTNEGVDIIFN